MKKIIKKDITRKTRYEEIVVEPAKRLLNALSELQETPPKNKIRKIATSR